MQLAYYDLRDPADLEIIEQTLAIIAKECAIDPDLLQPEARIDELGIASIDLVQTMFAIESHFDVEIPVVPQQSGAEFATVGDLIEHTLSTIKSISAGQDSST